MEDMFGNIIKVGDTVDCAGLKFTVDKFDKNMVCGMYGCFAADLLKLHNHQINSDQVEKCQHCGGPLDNNLHCKYGNYHDDINL